MMFRKTVAVFLLSAIAACAPQTSPLTPGLLPSPSSGKVTPVGVVMPILIPTPSAAPVTVASPTLPPLGTQVPRVTTGHRATRFGVITGAAVASQPQVVKLLTDLGASWVRINFHLDDKDPDYTPLLEAGINLIITFNNADPTNIDTTYGTPKEWPNAGFPFKSKQVYQQRVRAALAPALPYLSQGRQVWVQAGNEITDASINPKAPYWRGTTDQYLNQLQAFYEVVRTINPSLPVVLTSFASGTLAATLDPKSSRHDLADALLMRLLTAGEYDVVDLHFYGCVEEIAAQVQWVKGRLPAGKRWVSTENGGPDARCRATPLTWDQNQSKFEQVQAQQVPLRLSACADNGGSICLWFSLFDLRNEADVFTHLGLLDPSVIPPRKKPAYDTFKSFVSSHP